MTDTPKNFEVVSEIDKQSSGSQIVICTVPLASPYTLPDIIARAEDIVDLPVAADSLDLL